MNLFVFAIWKALHNKFIYIMLHPYCVWDLFCRIVFLISQSYAQGYIHKIRDSLYVTTYIFLFLFFHILLIAMCLIKLTSYSTKSSCHFCSPSNNSFVAKLEYTQLWQLLLQTQENMLTFIFLVKRLLLIYLLVVLWSTICQMTNYGKSLKSKLSHLLCQKHKTRREGNGIKMCPHSSGFHLNAFSERVEHFHSLKVYFGMQMRFWSNWLALLCSHRYRM